MVSGILFSSYHLEWKDYNKWNLVGISEKDGIVITFREF